MKVLKQRIHMDQLVQDLKDAITKVTDDESVLEAAVAAVKASPVVTGADANDAVVAALVSALEAAGYTVTDPVAPAPAA